MPSVMRSGLRHLVLAEVLGILREGRVDVARGVIASRHRPCDSFALVPCVCCTVFAD